MDELRKEDIDWILENSIIEMKTGLVAIRDLRDRIFKLAYSTLRNDPENAYLILCNSHIRLKRITGEWEKAIDILKTYLANRMFLVVYENSRIIWNSKGIQPEKLEQLAVMYCKETRTTLKTLKKTDFNAEVLKTLLNVWIVNEENPSGWISEDCLPFTVDDELPDQRLLTITKLGEMAGCTYRTVDKALEFIGTAVERSGNKGFGLKYFPRYAWEQMVVLSSKSRSTMKFTDRSGRPRSPDSLLKRLGRLKRSDIAIGGVTGASRIFPELDITGSPRLDLTIHCPNGEADMGFIKHLDPAQRPWHRNDPPPSLVVHFLRRKPSFFRINKEGILWADPIECLLDLQEAKLYRQALQFKQAMLPEGVN